MWNEIAKLWREGFCSRRHELLVLNLDRLRLLVIEQPNRQTKRGLTAGWYLLRDHDEILAACPGVELQGSGLCPLKQRPGASIEPRSDAFPRTLAFGATSNRGRYVRS